MSGGAVPCSAIGGDLRRGLHWARGGNRTRGTSTNAPGATTLTVVANRPPDRTKKSRISARLLIEKEARLLGEAGLLAILGRWVNLPRGKLGGAVSGASSLGRNLTLAPCQPR